MITQDEVRSLLDYTARDGVAVSFYLNTDVRRKDMQDIETKDLIKNARRELDSLDLPRTYRQAAEDNLKKISKYISLDNSTARYRSVAIFSNSAEKFTRIFWLPIHVKSRLVIDTTFYIRPLLTLLEEHYRLGVILLDSKHARFFEIYIGEILEHFDFSSPARNPRKPFLETFMKREKRLAQRKEEETRSHLCSVADFLKTHFLTHHFDKLIIGAKKPAGEHLSRLLHPRLHENLLGIFEIDIHAKESEILAMALSIETEFEMREESKLLRKIMNEVEKNGYAVKGLRQVIEAAQEHSLQEVVVADDFSLPGMVCTGCGMPHFSEAPSGERKACISCGKELTHAPDVLYYVVEEAVRQNATIRHIRGTNLISSLENVAAVVKFRKDRFTKIEEAVETES